MIVRFRRGNMAETRPVHGKLDHHVSAGRKRDGYKQLPVSVEFPKYGNTLFRPVHVSGYGDHKFAQLNASVRTIVLSLLLVSFSKGSHFSVGDRFKVAVVARI